MSIISDMAGVIREIINEVILVDASYTFPVREIKPPYPAVLILYDGFTRPEVEDDSNAFVHDLKYEITLYLKNDGRDMEARWDEMNSLTWNILLRFANDRTLGHTCRESLISAGEPVVHLTDKQIPVGLGHTFSMLVRIETAED
jgi:hypothetical protein